MILLSFAGVLYGQQKPAVAASSVNGKISGKVTDSVSKTPVDFATVSIFKQGAVSPFNGISTDKNGNFNISDLPPGDYKITIDFIGYRAKTIQHTIISNDAITKQLGNVLLAPLQTQLKTVSITASAPTVENKIDKLVYNPANDLTAQGGVALDVLKKVPMVDVDIDGNVQLQGSANIRFLINGKPSSIFGASLVDALQSIPASQIKSIEVITSPGAKYDASGTGGIINIVLKDNKVQGINGSVNLSAGTRLENGSLNLNARKGNIGFGLFFSGNEQLNTTTKNTINRLSYNNTKDTLSRLMQQGSNPFVRSGYRSGFNFSWSITKTDELIASVGFNHFGNHGTGFTVQDQSSYLATGNVLSDILSNRSSASSFSDNTTDFSFDYKKTFKTEGQELDLLYSASFGKNTSASSQLSSYPNGLYAPSGIQSNNPGTDHETDISADYIQPVSKGFTIETGAKIVLETLYENVVTDTLLNNGVYGLNSGQTYNFKYKRNIYAGYASATFNLFNNFLNGKAGLRYERTSTTADFAGVNIPGYNTLAPSFTLQHKIDETSSVKFSYSYRIERPDYNGLNPFYNISDPHNISTGNPFLKPEIGHNYELGYNKSFKTGANIYFAGVYRHNTNDIQGFTTFYDTLSVNGTKYANVSLSQPINVGVQNQYGANIFASVPITKQFNLRSNMQIGEVTNVQPGVASARNFSYRLNLNASYQFPDNFAAEIFGNYRSSENRIENTRPASFFYNIAVRKQFLNKNASVGLTAANPFNRYINQLSTAYGTDFNQTSLRQVPFRSFGITLSYKFGKLKFAKNKDDNGEPLQPSL